VTAQDAEGGTEHETQTRQLYDVLVSKCEHGTADRCQDPDDGHCGTDTISSMHFHHDASSPCDLQDLP